MKSFYRMEKKTTCEGPYREWGGRYGMFDNIVHYIMAETGENFSISARCPSPMFDRVKGHDSSLVEVVPESKQMGAVFGFCSLAQARNWWSKNPAVYDIFEKNGFVLRRYKVPQRFDAQKQSVAFKEDLETGVIIPFEKLLTTGKKATN